ncbi:MAG TPA: TonB-dependent receptor [Methylophaga sp.]|nr:TonB-dependent receptor [Methylophaga sp.]
MSSRPFLPITVSSFTLAILYILLIVGLPTVANAEDALEFNIPASSLDQALKRYGLEAKIQLYVDSSLTKGKMSSGLQGRFTASQGFESLLKGSNLKVIQQPNGAYQITSKTSPIAHVDVTDSDSIYIDTIDIIAKEYVGTRDESGYNDVFDKNISSVYVGKQELERFKGSAPADMLSGMLNVYSADARNSGGIDANIRGIQGPGRVPLTIDGTEQAITIWRGYNGANNRSYIDPNLIGNIKAIKGPNLERDVHSGIGGAVVASTLDIDDILKPGETAGGELKLEGSNNAVTANVPSLSTGKSYLDIPGYVAQGDIKDPTLLIEPHSGGQDYLNDYAYRLAVGTRQDFFDVMGAYAYRKKGNHFSGTHGKGFYSRGSDDIQDNVIPDLANIYKPGDELPNTSSEMQSWLAKVKLKISDYESISFGYRDSTSLYGEIFPSRISWESAVNDGVPQWPLSNVDSKAYNVEYKLNPETNRWVDFYANVWKTNTVSDTYTAGGYPNEPVVRNDPTNTLLHNTAVRNAQEDRKGVTLSNAFTIMDNLDLTLGGRYQKEKLSTDDEFGSPSLGSTFSLLPKAGRREEKYFIFNFAWKPTHFLSIDAGMRYSSFWTFDDFRQSRLDAGDTNYSNYLSEIGRTVSIAYDKIITQAEIDVEIQSNENQRDFLEMIGVPAAEIDRVIADANQQSQAKVGTTTPDGMEAVWEADSEGKYHRADNPCLTTDIEFTSCARTGERLYSDLKTLKKVKRLKGDGWAPVLSVALDINDDSKVYARHSQAYRFPSLFENTISFSASLPDPNYELKPEHIYNYEIGYVHDLAGLVDAEYADVKLNYFYNRTENVIDRSPSLVFSNLDKQTIKGIELQGRYDTGRFFTDLSLAYNFENEVCDENSAVLLDEYSTSNCVKDGFVGGYLVSMAMPEYTANMTVGSRFFNRKLELGSRVTYYSKHQDNFDTNYRDSSTISYFANTPLSWDTILLYDAYASYQVNNDLTVELTGTNLSNEYYIDPMTRSAIPAPGRTLKLSLTAKF